MEMPLGTVSVFLREGYLLPLSEGGENVSQVDFENLTRYSFGENIKPYEYYSDDGETKKYSLEQNIKIIK